MIKNIILSAVLLLAAVQGARAGAVFAYDNSILFKVPEPVRLAPREAFKNNPPVVVLERKDAQPRDLPVLILHLDSAAVKYEIASAESLARRKLEEAKVSSKGKPIFHFSDEVMEKTLPRGLQVFWYSTGRAGAMEMYMLHFTFDGRILSGACHAAEAETCWGVLDTMKALKRGSSKLRVMVKTKAPANR